MYSTRLVYWYQTFPVAATARGGNPPAKSRLKITIGRFLYDRLFFQLAMGIERESKGELIGAKIKPFRPNLRMDN